MEDRRAAANAELSLFPRSDLDELFKRNLGASISSLDDRNAVASTLQATIE